MGEIRKIIVDTIKNKGENPYINKISIISSLFNKEPLVQPTEAQMEMKWGMLDAIASKAINELLKEGVIEIENKYLKSYKLKQ
jgi:hypothetical protein